MKKYAEKENDDTLMYVRRTAVCDYAGKTQRVPEYCAGFLIRVLASWLARLELELAILYCTTH